MKLVLPIAHYHFQGYFRHAGLNYHRFDLYLDRVFSS